MDLGYSNLLGKHINASALDYNDCKRYHIVCPVCRERLFKARRTNSDGHERHYLSHFRSAAAHAHDCELRVASMGLTALDSFDHTTRGQYLDDYLRDFNDLISRDVEVLCPGDLNTQRLERDVMLSLSQSELLMEFAADLAGELQGMELEDVEGNFEGHAESYLTSFGEGEDPYYGRSEASQRRVAKDLWAHLLTPPALANFRCLFCRAYSVLIHRLEATTKLREVTEEERLLLDTIKGFPVQDAATANVTLRLMSGYPVDIIYGVDSTDLLEGLKSHLIEEMVGVLLRLPYEEALLIAEADDPFARAAHAALQSLSKSLATAAALTTSIQEVEGHTPTEYEEAVLTCLPQRGSVAREALLRDAAKWLGFGAVKKRVRRELNKAISRQVRDGLLVVEGNYERVRSSGVSAGA